MLHSTDKHSSTHGMLPNLDETRLATMNKPEQEMNQITFRDGAPVKRTSTATDLVILCNEEATQSPNLNA